MVINLEIIRYIIFFNTYIPSKTHNRISTTLKAILAKTKTNITYTSKIFIKLRTVNNKNLK